MAATVIVKATAASRIDKRLPLIVILISPSEALDKNGAKACPSVKD
jgi:hypothetical protein